MIKIAIFDTGFTRPDLNYRDGFILDDTGTFGPNGSHGDPSVSCLKMGLHGLQADIIPVKSSRLSNMAVIQLIPELVRRGVSIFNFNQMDTLLFYPSIREVAQFYGDRIIITAASGSSNADRDFRVLDREVLIIGAHDQDGNKEWFSNYGPDLWCLGPGGLTTDYGWFRGTSAASPYVAGVLANYLDRYGSQEAALDAAERNCVDVGEPGRDIKHGWGLITMPDQEVEMPWRDVQIRRNAHSVFARFNTDIGVMVSGEAGGQSVASNSVRRFERTAAGPREYLAHRLRIFGQDLGPLTLGDADGRSEIFK